MEYGCLNFKWIILKFTLEVKFWNNIIRFWWKSWILPWIHEVVYCKCSPYESSMHLIHFNNFKLKELLNEKNELLNKLNKIEVLGTNLNCLEKHIRT